MWEKGIVGLEVGDEKGEGGGKGMVVDKDTVTFENAVSFGIREPEAVCVVMPLNRVPDGEFAVTSEVHSVWPYKLTKTKESFETGE